MNDRTTRCYEAFLRAREFGTSRAAQIPADSLGTELLNNLNQIITQMDASSAQQSSGARSAQEATTSKSLARENLYDTLARISRTARGMRRAIPGLETKFRAPGKLKEQELLALARATAADALPLKTEFTKRGMPATFIDDLNEDIGEFEEALTRQTQGDSMQVAATAALEDLAANGIATLRELDPIIKNIFDDDPASLAAWASARHIERSPRRRTQTQAPPPPAT